MIKVTLIAQIKITCPLSYWLGHASTEYFSIINKLLGLGAFVTNTLWLQQLFCANSTLKIAWAQEQLIELLTATRLKEHRRYVFYEWS